MTVRAAGGRRTGYATPSRCEQQQQQQYKLGWVGKTYGYYYETDELPKPKANPIQEKLGLKVAFGPLFPTANIFSWVGIGFYRKQTTRNLRGNPTKLSQTPY